MNIRFYFDPICPWCWITSRWLVDVRKDRDLSIEWMPFSLAIKNDEDLTDEDTRHIASHKLLRMATDFSQPQLENFYTLSGTEIHLNDNHNVDDIAKKVIDELGLDNSLTAKLDDPKQDEALTKSIQTVTDVVGDDVGTPIILFESQDGWNGFFGPVLDSMPHHDDGLKLWDGLAAMASNNNFYELKRTRQSGPDTASTKR